MKQNITSQSGQTLVETMVAVFIMVMGVTAALGLAIYSFNATSLANKQVVAMGLAREGLEGVKNMRDTNWLKGKQFDVSCNCYLDWQDSYYSLAASGKGEGYTLDFNPTEAPYWNLDPLPLTYRMKYDPTAANGRLYYPSSDSRWFSFGPEGEGTTDSDYYRRITIAEETKSPYDATSPRLEVTVDVWWNDRKCPAVESYEQSIPSCSISLKSYLTNWKNY